MPPSTSTPILRLYKEAIRAGDVRLRREAFSAFFQVSWAMVRTHRLDTRSVNRHCSNGARWPRADGEKQGTGNTFGANVRVFARKRFFADKTPSQVLPACNRCWTRTKQATTA